MSSSESSFESSRSKSPTRLSKSPPLKKGTKSSKKRYLDNTCYVEDCFNWRPCPKHTYRDLFSLSRSNSSEELSNSPKVAPTSSSDRGPNRKRWLFTLNNYTDEEVEAMKSLALDKCRYMVFGYEKAPKTGTPHLQGYLELVKDGRMSMMHQYCRRLHFELKPVKGTAQENRKYCLKIRDKDVKKGTPPNEKFYEFGDCPTIGQGNRTDLENACAAVVSGGFIALNKPEFHPVVVKYSSGFKTLAQMTTPKRNFKTIVVVLVGKPGTGKSSLANQFPNPVVVPKPNGSSYWFDGYEPGIHETIILDDYRGNYPLDFFLEFTDRYQCTLPIKGGQVQMRAKYLVITSNRKPSEWYPKVYCKYPDQLQAVDRRLDIIIHFPKIGEMNVLRGQLPEGISLPPVAASNYPPVVWPDEGDAQSSTNFRPSPHRNPVSSIQSILPQKPASPDIGPVPRPIPDPTPPPNEPLTMRAYSKMTPEQIKAYKERTAKYKAEMIASLKTIN